MKIYIDSDYYCHITDPNGIYREVETNIFIGKCDTYVEGFRYIPIGESWISPEGVEIHGGYVAPWKHYDGLDAIQREYEQQLLNELQNEKQELNTSYNEGVNSI